MSSIPKRPLLATTALVGFDPIILAFIDDLRLRGEIAEGRVRHYRGLARHFLIWLAHCGIPLEAVESTVIDRFLQHDCDCCDAVPASVRLHPWRKRRTSPELMRFIRFLERTGRIETPGDLDDNLRLLEGFLERLRGDGYALKSIAHHRCGCAALVVWLHLSRIRLRDLTPDVYARFRNGRLICSIPGAFCGQRMRSPGGAYDREIRKFLGHLVAIGRIEPLEPAPEEKGHEVPPRDALGPASFQRPAPHLISIQDIQKLLTAALSMPPAGTIAPLTWHYLFGLVAATGLRIGEARALTFEDITPDGLIVRDTKFGKSRMVALDPTTRTALNRYLVARCKEKTQDEHLFVLGTGRPPGKTRVSAVFLELAEQTGIREPGATRGPSSHSLRHSFAVRSLENLEPGADPGRHMLALASYLGHVDVSGTYWYLDSTPVLLRGIAEAAEKIHMNGDSDD